MPSRSALGALPRTGTGAARERGRRPLGHVAGLWPACGRDARAPRGWPCERCSWERGHLARNGPKARKALTGATRPSRPPRRRRPMPSRSVLGAMFLGARASCPQRAEGPQSADRSDMPEPATPPPEAVPSRSALGALPRTGTGGARERGRRPLAHVAGLWPACGRDARAPRVWPCERCPGSAGILPATGRRPAKRRQERHARAGHPPARGAQCRRGRPWERCPWERGHLARIGPKARKVPTGATRPSRPPPRPRRPMPSRSALGALPRTGTGGARERGRRPLAHVAGLWPACGRDARAPRGWPCERCPGSAGILPATGRRPAKRRQERHARAGHPPARGAQCRRGRPWERCPWERGHLARIGPKARKVPTGATRPSRPPPARGAQCRRGRPWVHCRGLALEEPESAGVARLPMWRACGPLAGGTPALPGGGPVSDVPGSAGILPARPSRAEGPQSADRSDTPEPATPPPEAPNAVEVGLGCTAEDWHWRAWASPACPARPVSDVPVSAGILPATGRRPAKCRQERHARAATPPASPAGVARLPMWRACGPLAGGTPALPGGGPVSDVPGSAGILPARPAGRRPAKAPTGATRPSRPPPRPRRPLPSRPALGALPRTGTGEARERGRRPLAHVAGLWPACGRDARAPRVWPCERCSWERGHLARNGPKARKALTGATCPSRPPPRPRCTMPSTLGALPRTGAGEARERGRRPLAHVAGLWPACGRDARAPRGWPWE